MKRKRTETDRDPEAFQPTLDQPFPVHAPSEDVVDTVLNRLLLLGRPELVAVAQSTLTRHPIRTFDRTDTSTTMITYAILNLAHLEKLKAELEVQQRVHMDPRWITAQTRLLAYEAAAIQALQTAMDIHLALWGLDQA